MESKQAACNVVESSMDGTVLLRFTYRDDSLPNDRSFKLLTQHDEFKAEWIIDYKCCELELIQSNKNISGEIIINWSCMDVKSSIGFFDSETLPFKQSFESQKELHCNIALFLRYRLSVNGKELRTLYEDMEILFEKKECSDMIFIVKKEEIPGHKQILSTRNKTMANMLTREKLESCDYKVKIDDIEPNIFKLFLKYLYCKKIHIKDDNEAQQISAVAKKYSAKELLQICQTYNI